MTGRNQPVRLTPQQIRAEEAAPGHAGEADERHVRKKDDPAEIPEADDGPVPVHQIGEGGFFRGDDEQERDLKRMEKDIFQENGTQE